jgi:hypothetical protein
MPPLTREDIEEFAAWFEHLVANTNPDDMCMPPEKYRSTAAWLQLFGMGAVDANSDVKPWNMPPDIADFYSGVWYANRLAALRVAQRQGAVKPKSPLDFTDRGKGPGPLFGGDVSGW